jgi:hypothetical protein
MVLVIAAAVIVAALAAHEFGQSTLVSRERFRREFGTDVRISQVCTYGEIPQRP